ncbi:MAG: Trk system potassium transporter TrkA [Sumerlaeia bacterium]
MIVVVGAGTVGSNIAQYLTRDDHEVIVIDRKAEKLRDLEDHLDVQTFIGDAADPSILKKIKGYGEISLLLAVTDHDATNLIIGYSAKAMGIPRVVARVRSPFFLDSTHVNFRDPLGIDLLISPEILTAQELAKFVENPAALATATLAQGRVEIRTVMLSPFSKFSDVYLRDLHLPPGVLLAVIRRGTEVFIPKGDDSLVAGDHITLIGLPEVLEHIHPEFDTEQDTKSGSKLKVAIAGAGETGLFLAKQLEAQGHRVTLIDKDRARLEFVGESLHKTRLLYGDATQIQFLREEGIGDVDYFFSTTGDDEDNVMSALLARELKIRHTACIIDRPDYVRVVERVGIDIALSPRIIAANRVMTLVKQGKIRSVTLLEEGAVEINEYQALSKSMIVGKALKDVILPKGVLIGAIVCGNSVTIPRGNHIIRPRDIVIAVAEADMADTLDQLFREQETETTA